MTTTSRRYLFLVDRVTAKREWIVLDWCLIRTTTTS